MEPNRSLLLPGVLPEMLRPEFWCSRFRDRDLGTGWMRDIQISYKDAVEQYFRDLDVRLGTLYNPDGSRIADAVNDLIGWSQPGYGLITQPADLKLLPREEPLFSNSAQPDLDRNQLSGLDPGDPVCLFAVSPDGKWFGAVSDAGAGWVNRNAVGVGNEEKVENYKNETSVLTAIEPNSRILADGQIIGASMGCTFPLRDHIRRTILVPGRNSRGNLKFKTGIIIEETVRDYLPKTAHHLIRQGLKYLGFRYAWGDHEPEGYGRDCSRLVRDVLRTMGFKPPRNSRDQLVAGQKRLSLTGMNTSEKLIHLKRLFPGSLLFTPSHVMIFLGEHRGEGYVLHALSSYRQVVKEGEETISVKQVVVSGLSLGCGTSVGSLLDRLTDIIEV